MFPINTKLFAGAFPFLQTIYSPDQELDFEIKIFNPRVVFGPDSGDDVRFYFDARYGLKKLQSMNYIIYDILHIELTLDFEIQREVLFANVNKLQISLGGEPSDRKAPIYSDMNVSEE